MCLARLQNQPGDIYFERKLLVHAMHQERVDGKEGSPNRTDGMGHMKLAAYLVLSVLLVAIAWCFPKLAAPIVGHSIVVLLFLAVIYALVTVSLERGLAQRLLPRNWHYRLAFLLSAGLAALQVLIYAAFQISGLFSTGINQNWFFPLLVILASIIVTTLGAFTGALISTALNDGLMEVNTPPASLTKSVYEKHLLVIGVPGAESKPKRWFDASLAVFGLVLSAPVWLAAIFLIWMEDPGPVLFVKNSIGKGGRNFRLLKFRTMAREMEKSMALVQTQEVETNTLSVGRILRKTALDELPQLMNILVGEMSFVGPRPHRTPLVALYLEQIPEFAERHRVLPGLAGLAQVSGDFYMTPRQKLRFDRLYIQHKTLGFDIKLMFLAFLITFWYRWQKDWNGRLPRRYLHSR